MKKILYLALAVLAVTGTFYLPPVITPDGRISLFFLVLRVAVCLQVGMGCGWMLWHSYTKEKR